MKNNHDIDTMFNEASQNEEKAAFPGFDRVWDQVEAKLDHRKHKKRSKITAWMPYGIAASVLLCCVIFFFGDRKATGSGIKTGAAQYIAMPQESRAADAREPIRESERSMPSGIQTQSAPAAPGKVALREDRQPYAYLLPESGYRLTENRQPELPATAEKRAVPDSAQRLSTEEVRVTGIRKEKASAASIASITWPAGTRVHGARTMADTAEAAYPEGADAFKKDEEPQVLAYNPSHLLKNNLTAHTGNRDGKAALTIRGAASGLAARPTAGTSGSGPSFETGSDPLVIIDGAITDIGIFRKMDSKKVATVNILTAEQAIPLFGSRAMHGVIMVETRSISRKEKRKMKKILEAGRPGK